MYKRRIFTVDPLYFPLARMQEIVDYLHSHNQKFGKLGHRVVKAAADGVAVLMTDPAVAYLPGEGYGPYDRGSQMDIWMKADNGSYSLGAVWPGMFLLAIPDYPDLQRCR